MTNALELSNVVKHFGSFTALEGISFDLKRGEFLTMLGPSGSGKTTTLRIIAGFHNADSGQILVNGRDLTRLPTHKRNIGMVFQDYALFPHMTVRDNVGFPLGARGVSKRDRDEKVEEMLDVVGLGKFAGRVPAQLSGGQQQRVALARALVFGPEIVLLDEPLSALDKKLRTTMQLEILRITRRFGATVISVTHDQEEALVMSDRIVLFSQGRLAQIGTPQQLYQEPKSEFVANFIGESNILRGPVRDVGAGSFSIAGDEFVAQLGLDRVARPPMVGQQASFMVRPERMTVSPLGAESGPRPPNAVDLTVTDIAYVGTGIRLVGRSNSGAGIQAWLPNIDVGGRYRQGDQIRASWQAEDARALSA